MAFASSAAGRPRSPAARWRQRLWRNAPLDAAPLRLRHGRIYILPTRRGLALLASTGLMLLTALNYSLSLGFVVTFVIIGFGASALLHTFRNLAGITLQPLAAGATFAGGTLPFVIALTGGSGVRRGFVLHSQEAQTDTFDIPAGTALSLTLHRAAPTRGRLALGRVTLATDYPVGLWRAWAYVHFPLEGIVYPAPEPSPPPLPMGGEGHETVVSAGHDDADLAGLQEFQPGDPLQRVAWKAVARGAGWYTKAFEGSGGGGPVTLAWDALPAGMGYEARVARLTAWVLAAERVARPFALRLPGRSVAMGQGREQRRDVLTALALLPHDQDREPGNPLPTSPGRPS
ncbi:MAG: DUF58 domain-containing protein [Casimicrobiaceae bacterium]